MDASPRLKCSFFAFVGSALLHCVYRSSFIYIYEEEERGWRTRGREKEDRGGWRGREETKKDQKGRRSEAKLKTKNGEII